MRRIRERRRNKLPRRPSGSGKEKRRTERIVGVDIPRGGNVAHCVGNDFPRFVASSEYSVGQVIDFENDRFTGRPTRTRDDGGLTWKVIGFVGLYGRGHGRLGNASQRQDGDGESKQPTGESRSKVPREVFIHASEVKIKVPCSFEALD